MKNKINIAASILSADFSKLGQEVKDVDKAVKAAQKAFEGEWPKLLPRERAKFLRAIGDQLRANAEMLGEIETIDTGKLFRETKKQAIYIEEYYE